MYDSETGLYYLESRYYNPELSRFISADDVLYLGINETLLSYNLFAYCENNPISLYDSDGHAAINVLFAAVGAIAGWALGDYVAKKLGYRSGWKYWAIRSGVVVGGAVIGWFAGSLLTKILSGYLKSNPAMVFKLANRLGKSKFYSALKFLGINPFSLATNSSKFVAIARLLNSKAITLSYEWAIKLYNKAKAFGYSIELDKPHGGYSWHIHINRLSNLHIQITKKAWDYLKKLLG